VTRAIALALALVGCRGSHDAPAPTAAQARSASAVDVCQAFVTRAWNYLPALAPTKATPEQFVASCQKMPETPSVVLCVAGANDNLAVKTCLTDSVHAASQAFLDHLKVPMPAGATSSGWVPVRMPPPRLRYSAKTDASSAGTNPTYFSIIEDAPLFIVADSANPDASKLASSALSSYPPQVCATPDDDYVMMRCAFRVVNDRLVQAGKTAALAAVTIHGQQAVVANAGDVRVMWRHGDAFDPLSIAEDTAPLGSSSHAKAMIREVVIHGDDTLVILNRGLFDAAGETKVRDTTQGVAEIAQLDAAIEQLLAAGAKPTSYPARSAIVVHVVGP
jgi:hypothetical protein